MKKFHKFSLMALLSVALLFMPLQGNRGVRAQGLPTIDLSNLTTAIMNWLQDQDVAGFFSTASGAAISVEEWTEKLAQVATYVGYAQMAIDMYNSGAGIFICLMDIWHECEYLGNTVNYFMKMNAPITILQTARFLAADFSNYLTETLNDVSETIARYTTMGLGNALSALRMTEEVAYDIRDKLFQAVSYYRSGFSELMSYWMSIKRAASNVAYMTTLFY